MAILETDRPSKGVIEIVDQSGKILEAKTLERPFAKLRTAELYGDTRSTYLLTVDYSAGFGSYSGPITSLVEVKNGHLSWVNSTDPKTGKTGDISLKESLKTTWKFVDAPDGMDEGSLNARQRKYQHHKLSLTSGARLREDTLRVEARCLESHAKLFLASSRFPDLTIRNKDRMDKAQ